MTVPTTLAADTIGTGRRLASREVGPGRRQNTAVITGRGTAVPDAMPQREVWDEFFGPRLGGDRLAERIFMSCGISTRHAVADPRATDVSSWSTGERMRAWLPAARELGGRAVRAALDDAGLAASDVGQFVVVTCTGYATPGLDIVLAEELGMPLSVQRVIVGHMGCYAAVPGLGTAADFVRSRGLPSVVLCVELTSLHIQPSTDPRDLQQVVAHALFADAASAVVIEPDAPAGLELLDTAAVTAPGSAPLMTWDVTDHGFRMGLSPKVPDVLSLHAVDAVDALLKPHDVSAGEVTGWAVHPGGPRIVDVVAERLRLEPAQVEASRSVLDRYGNCSSGTVLMVLDEMRRAGAYAPGDDVVAMAFGPSLTMYSALFRAR